MARAIIVLNIISIIVGTPSMAFALIMPYLGAFALPSSLVALILSIIALIFSFKKKKGKVFSFITITIALVATIASIAWIVEIQNTGHLL